TGNTSFEELVTGNVARFLQFAGVDAEIAVGGLEQAAQVVEAQRIVDGQSADETETDAFVNQAVEVGEFVGVARTGTRFGDELRRARAKFQFSRHASLRSRRRTQCAIRQRPWPSGDCPKRGDKAPGLRLTKIRDPFLAGPESRTRRH